MNINVPILFAAGALCCLEKVPALSRRKHAWLFAALLTELLFFLVFNTSYFYALSESLIRRAGMSVGLGAGPRFSAAASPLSFALEFVLCCLLVDLGNWIGHYVAHRWQPFAAFHKVHHSITEVNCLNFSHLHICDVWCRVFLVSAPFYLVCPFVPVSAYAFLNAKLIFWGYGYFIHSSLNLPWLESQRWYTSVFATPAYHRVHHRSDVDGRNLAIVFVFWDKIFGIYQAPGPIAEPLNYGLSAGEAATYPRGFFAQHLEAFRELFRAVAKSRA